MLDGWVGVGISINFSVLVGTKLWYVGGGGERKIGGGAGTRTGYGRLPPYFTPLHFQNSRDGRLASTTAVAVVAPSLTLRPLESCTETVMKGDWRSAVLCITSLSRWKDRYVSDDSFTGGAFGTNRNR